MGFLKLCNGREQPGPGNAFDSGISHRACRQSVYIGYLGSCQLHFTHGALHVECQNPAFFRKQHPIRAAIEQRCLEAVLKVLDLATNG